jgi:putative redox protein
MSHDRNHVTAELRWDGGLRFDTSSGDTRLMLDADGHAGPSPVVALVTSLASCMAADVVHVLFRARLPLRSLTVRVDAERAPTDPRRLRRATLVFVVEGAVPDERVEHAIGLSRETYCSVWHSLARDIELTTSVVRA